MIYSWVPVMAAKPPTYKEVSVKDKAGQTAKAIWTGLSWKITQGKALLIVAWLA